MTFPSHAPADLAVASLYLLHPLTVAAAREMGVLERLLVAVERRMGVVGRRAA